MGIEEQRFRLEWISASEGDKVKAAINDMVEQVRALGPLGLPKRFKEWDKEMAGLEEQIGTKDISDAQEVLAHV
jgi:hypothetical protein